MKLRDVFYDYRDRNVYFERLAFPNLGNSWGLVFGELSPSLYFWKY